MKTFLQALIRFYALVVSPFTSPSCRFHPTCSVYAHESIARHGAFKGLLLTLCRLSRCHPWSRKHDFCDPVPETFDWRGIIRYKRRNKKTPETKEA